MFYVKEMMGDAVEVNIEINDENVFCRCPHCGSEVQVDLQEILSDSDSDLFGTAVLCENCTRRIMGGEMDGKGICRLRKETLSIMDISSSLLSP